MAKDKDRALNPAAAALKQQKKSALKKSKAAVATQRTERLAKRNPDRLQRQIDDLKTTEEAQGGQLKPRDKQQLEQLERDVKAIKKAREGAPGANAPRERTDRDGGTSRGSRGGREDTRRGREGRMSDGGNSSGRTLGKRRRSPARTPSPPTDEDVRRIQMPRDTPPPIPVAVSASGRPPRRTRHGNPNDTPLGDNARIVHALPPKPVAQTTYSSAPQLRDLQKEATAKFVPAAVAARLKAREAFVGVGGLGRGTEGQAQGRLLEPEQVDKLEREGYLDARMAADEAGKGEAIASVALGKGHNRGEGRGQLSLEDEEAAFERELMEAEAEAMVEDNVGMESDLDRRKAEQDPAHAETKNDTKTSDKSSPRRETKAVAEEQAQHQLRFAEVEDAEDETWG